MSLGWARGALCVQILLLMLCTAPVGAETSRRTAAQPFGLTLGKSTLTDAQVVWRRENATVASQGFGEAKPTSRDNDNEGGHNGSGQ
jgi:hypothetical protein